MAGGPRRNTRSQTKKCRNCNRSFGKGMFLSELKSRKFCSSLCYHTASRTPSGKQVFHLQDRKRIMAMAAHHKDQASQLAYALNSTDADEMEKLAVMGMFVREMHEAQGILTEYFKSMSKREREAAKEYLVRNPGRKKLRGPHWCRTCGATMVPGPFMDCQKCIDSRYTAKDHEDAMEPFERHRDDTKV